MMSLQFSVKQMVSCCQPTRPSGDNFFMAYACSADERKSEFDYMHIIQSRIRMLQFSLCVLERRRYVDCIRRRQPQSMRHQGLHSSSKTLIRILYFIACILVFNVELTIRAVKDLRHFCHISSLSTSSFRKSHLLSQFLPQAVQNPENNKLPNQG